MMRNQSEEFHKTHASELTEYLYLAACRAVTSKCLLDLKITSIVNATLELPTVAYQKQDTIQIAVEDKVGAKLNIYFDLIADKINQVHLAGGKILIYCRAGQSRSVTLCIAYFMKYHDMNYEQAYQFVRNRRPIIHPNRGFIHQLKEYEVKLQTKPMFTAPSISRNNSFKLASRLSFAVDMPSDDPAFLDADASWDKAMKPFRPGRSRVMVSLHEPLASIVDRHEVVVVDACGEHPKLPLAPLPETAGVELAEGRGVATTALHHATIGPLPDTEPLNARAKRRAAFTKLTKPNDIAVSALNIPLDFVISSDSKVFKIQTKSEHCSAAIPDLLEAHAVSEEVLPECLGTVAKALIAGERARAVICLPWECATQHWTVPLLWPQQLCDTKHLPAPTPAHPSKAPRGWRPVRPATTSSRPSGRGSGPPRTQALAVSVTPAWNPPSPARVLVKRCSDYRACATHLAPPLLWERAAGRGAGQPSVEKTEKAVKVVRGCNSIAVLTTLAWQAVQPAPLLDIPIDSYHKLDFSFATFEVSQIASKSTAVFLGAESVEFGQAMTVIREFPYYSTVLLTSALDMARASEEAKLNVKWFKVEKPKSQRPDPVELIMRISEQKQEEQRRKVSTPVVKWGTERCLTDDFQTPLAMTTRLPTSCTAVRYRVMPVREHLTDTLPFIWLKTELLGKFYVPHYNPVLVMRRVGATIRPVALATQPTLLDMTNLYTAPRTLPMSCDKATKAVHMDCLAVTTVYMPQIKTNFEMEDIPNEIHDIQEIKRVLAEDGESNKCKIWFDVFKRTLMRKRPTYPKVSRSEFLPTATVSSCILLEFSVPLPTDSFIPQTAVNSRQRPPLAVATIREVKEIEKYTEFARFVKPTLVPEKFTAGLVFSDDYVIVCGTGWAWESCEPFSQSAALPTASLERAVSSVAFPNRLYTVGEVKVQGMTGEYSTTGYRRQARTAFTVLTQPRVAATCMKPLRLAVASPLPEYQFVQDIEEQADEEYHRSVATCRAGHTKTDAFWFFAMETSVAPEEQGSSTYPGLPGASTYRLFLPDSELASRIGEETMFPDDSAEARSATGAFSVVNSEAVVDAVMLEIKEAKPAVAMVAPPATRVTRRGSHRVAFIPEEEDEQKKRIKTIYYGRDRSKSRTRLKDVPKDIPKQQRGATARPRRDLSAIRFKEEEVMANLESSVNEANDILTRRRGRESLEVPASPYTPVREVAPTSPYSGVHSPRLTTRSEERHSRRSRDSELNRRETERYERNKRMMAEAQQLATAREVEPSTVEPVEPSSVGFGLLTFAQTIFKSRSRREQSKDRSRALVRRSRNFM